MHNFTEDAHPIHVHEVQFEIVNREPVEGGSRTVRLALPHPRTRGQRDDAALPHHRVTIRGLPACESGTDGSSATRGGVPSVKPDYPLLR